MENLEKIVTGIFEVADYFGEIELGDYEILKDGIKLEIKTLTSLSDPEVHYYDDGYDSIECFGELVSEKYQVETSFKEDFLMNGNEYDDWVVRDGWLQVAI